MSNNGVGMKRCAVDRPRSEHDREGNEGVFGVSRSLVEARTSAGLAQAELARRMRVPTHVLQRWESGEATPSFAMVKEFAALTGRSIRVTLVSPEARTTAPLLGDSAAQAPLGDPCIMTIDEIAELLRLNRKTVYELARQGKIPVRRVGKSLRASRETVMRWLADGVAPREGRLPRRVPSNVTKAPRHCA